MKSSTTVTFPSGNSRLRRKKSPIDRPKKKVSETGSGSYRQRANSKEHERSPKTEKDSFDTENDTVGQYPCLAGLHISEYKKVSCETKNLVGDFISYVFRATLIIPPVLLLIPKL